MDKFIKNTNYDQISVVKKLDKDLIITNGNDFYAIGLSLFPYMSSNRKSIFNPYFVFAITFGYTLKLMITLRIESNESRVFLLTGDWSYFLGARYQMSFSALTYGMLSSASQLIHFWYYWRGIEPTYLEPFKVIAGFVSPIEVGLIDKSDVIRWIVRSKLYYIVAKVILMSRVPVPLLLAGIPLLVNARSPLEYTSAIIWTVTFSYWVYLTAGHLIYQILYFSILCHYFKIKVKHLNQTISNAIRVTKAVTPQNVKDLAKDYHSIHNEISKTNDNHWSLYLLLVVLACMIICNMCIYTSFYGTSNLILKIVFLYIGLMFVVFLLFVLRTASSVVIECHKTYSILNVLYGKQQNLLKSKLNKLKLINLIEKLSEKRFGFYCWKAFIIDNYKTYELVMLTMAFFMKLVDMSASVTKTN